MMNMSTFGIIFVLYLNNISAKTFEFDDTFVANKYFIDKTPLMTKFFKTKFLRYNYITCPRHFGKSTNLKMIRKFAEIELDENHRRKSFKITKAYRLFRNLKIADDDYTMNHHLAQHPVIMLNFTSVNLADITSNNITYTLNEKIHECFKDNEWLLGYKDGNESLTRIWTIPDDVKFMEKALNKSLNLHEIENSLNILSRILFRYFNNTEIVALIDDIDIIPRKGLINPSNPEGIKLYVNFIKNLLNFTLGSQNENIIGHSLLVGITRFVFGLNEDHGSKIFSHGFLQDHKFMPFFGFLQPDVDTLCHRHSCNDSMKYIFKKRYGYLIHNRQTVIYNPHMITSYLSCHRSKTSLVTKMSQKVSQQHENLIIERFLDIPDFLEMVSELYLGKTVHLHVLHAFNYNYDSDIFFDLLATNLSGVRDHHIDLLTTYLFEQGLLVNIDEKRMYYVTPNESAKWIFHHNFRLYYHKKGITLESIAEGFLQMMNPTSSVFPARKHLANLLTHQFSKIPLSNESLYLTNGPYYETVFQAVIYTALMKTPSLNLSIINTSGAVLLNEIPDDGGDPHSMRRKVLLSCGAANFSWVIELIYKYGDPIESVLIRNTSTFKAKFMRICICDNRTVSLIVLANSDEGKFKSMPELSNHSSRRNFFIYNPRMWLGSSIVFILANVHLTTQENFQYDMAFVENPYFIDKSELLAHFFEKGGLTYRYVMAPRGFGKSVNLAMIRKFSEIQLDENYNPIHWIRTSTYKLFKCLKIGPDDNTVTNHLARYPVIFLNMSNAYINEMIKENVVSMLNEQISQCYKDHEWLLMLHNKNRSASKLTDEDIVFMYSALNKQLTPLQIMDSLKVLSQILYNHFNKEVIVLIDDIDKIILDSFINSHTDSVANKFFVKLISLTIDGIFEFERNKYTGYGLLVGVSGLLFSISDSSIKEVLVHSHRFLEDSKFTPYFGFLQKDVDRLCRRFLCSKSVKTVLQACYNGYITNIKFIHIYNPNSVIQYFKTTNHSNAVSPRPFWQIPEHCAFIGKYLVLPPFLEKISALLLGNSITFNFKRYHHYSFVFDLLKIKYSIIHGAHIDTLLTFLVEQGILTISPNQQNDIAYMIPNQEVRVILFQQLLEFYHRKEIQIEMISDCFVEMLPIPKNRVSKLTQWLQEMLASSFASIQLVDASDWEFSEEPTEVLFEAVVYIALANNVALNVSIEVCNESKNSHLIVYGVEKKLGMILLRYHDELVDIPLEKVQNVCAEHRDVKSVALIIINIMESNLQVRINYLNEKEINQHFINKQIQTH